MEKTVDYYEVNYDIIRRKQNWNIEDGSEALDEGAERVCLAPVIENKEKDILWYNKYFLRKEHTNYIGMDENFGPYVLSVCQEEVNSLQKMRTILWLHDGPRRKIWTKKSVKMPSDILKKIDSSLKRKKLKMVKSEKIDDLLSTMEGKILERNSYYKFGVLLVRSGQKEEEEIFSNRVESQDFKNFLSLLGEKLPLENYKGYSAGLDTSSEKRTGEYSVATNYNGYEIMYHISTMLPFTKGDNQQIERKRHIGNDIVIIIFLERDSHDLWILDILKSKFPHIYVVVKPMTLEDGKTGYKINFAIKDCLNSFGPFLPHPPVLEDMNLFRNFLLTKLINGEREAIRSLSEFRSSTSFITNLREIWELFSKKNRISLSNNFQLNLGDTFKIGIPKLKRLFDLDKTSAVQAFEIRYLCRSVPFRVTCCELWGKKIIIGTSVGIYLCDPESSDTFIREKSNSLIERRSSESKTTWGKEDTRSRYFKNSYYVKNKNNLRKSTFENFWKTTGKDGNSSFFNDIKSSSMMGFTRLNIPNLRESFHIKKIMILEPIGVLIVDVRSIGIYIVDLLSLEDVSPSNFFLEKTRSCIFFTVGIFNNLLLLCCASKDGIIIFNWERDIFKYLEFFSLPETPRFMEFDRSGKLLIGLSTSCAVISLNREFASFKNFFSWKDTQVNPMDIIIIDETNKEYFICFNKYGIFVNEFGKRTRSIEIWWDSSPNSVVYVYPYILGFSPFQIEIRSIANGSLIQIIETDDSEVIFCTPWPAICYSLVSNCESFICSLQLNRIPTKISGRAKYSAN